jgi:hypothetical protein
MIPVLKMMMRNKSYEFRNTRKNDQLLKLIKTACYGEEGNFFRKPKKDLH